MPYLVVGLRLAMLATYASPVLSTQHAVFPRSVVFLRYLFAFSSHCFQVYSHSQITSLPSLLHVHPFVALCFVSTVLLVSLLVPGHWLAALLSSKSLVLAVHFFTTCFLSSHSRRAIHQHLLVPSAVVCVPPVVSLFPSPREGLRVLSPRIYIIHPPVRYSIVKFAHLPIAHTIFMLPSR